MRFIIGIQRNENQWDEPSTIVYDVAFWEDQSRSVCIRIVSAPAMQPSAYWSIWTLSVALAMVADQCYHLTGISTNIVEVILLIIAAQLGIILFYLINLYHQFNGAVMMMNHQWWQHHETQRDIKLTQAMMWGHQQGSALPEGPLEDPTITST